MQRAALGWLLVLEARGDYERLQALQVQARRKFKNMRLAPPPARAWLTDIASAMIRTLHRDLDALRPALSTLPSLAPTTTTLPLQVQTSTQPGVPAALSLGSGLLPAGSGSVTAGMTEARPKRLDLEEALQTGAALLKRCCALHRVGPYPATPDPALPRLADPLLTASQLAMDQLMIAAYSVQLRLALAVRPDAAPSSPAQVQSSHLC